MGLATRLALALRVLAYAPVAKHLPGDVANVGASLWLMVTDGYWEWTNNLMLEQKVSWGEKDGSKLGGSWVFDYFLNQVKVKRLASWIVLDGSRIVAGLQGHQSTCRLQFRLRWHLPSLFFPWHANRNASTRLVILFIEPQVRQQNTHVLVIILW